MNTCTVCCNMYSEFDGEVVYNYDGTESGDCSIEESCKLGRDEYFKVKGKGCNRYKEILAKCVGCECLVPITKLKDGFHCNDCKNKYIDRIKDILVKSKEEYNMVRKELKVLKDNKSEDDKIIDLQNKLDALEEDIQYGENILKTYNMTEERID